MPFQSYLNGKLIGPDGLYTKEDTAPTKDGKQNIAFTALTRGVAYHTLCKAKKIYFGNKPWCYIKSQIKEIK
jgi:hypothetical protein